MNAWPDFIFPEQKGFKGSLLDDYLATGYYRMQHHLFTTHRTQLSVHQKAQPVFWLRIPVKNIIENTTAKAIRKKCAAFTVIFNKAKIKQIPEKSIETFGFIVKDNDEAIFFIKNEENEAQDQLALSTDSIGMINNLKMSFDLIWSNQNNISDKGNTAKKSNQDYEFKLKEMQQQNLILQEINDYLQKATDNPNKKVITAKSMSKKSKD